MVGNMAEEMENEDTASKNKKPFYTEEERLANNAKILEWKRTKLKAAFEAAHEAIENGEDVWITGKIRNSEDRMIRASEIKDWGLSSSITRDLKKGDAGYYASKIL